MIDIEGHNVTLNMNENKYGSSLVLLVKQIGLVEYGFTITRVDANALTSGRPSMLTHA
jgi:hypothetical protein